MKWTGSTASRTGLLGVWAGTVLTMGGVAAGQVGGQNGDDPYGDLPAQVSLSGVARDFRGADEANGHPDFQVVPAQGSALYYGSVADALDEDGKPVYASGGYKQVTPWTDGQGRAIIPPKDYLESRQGDVSGSMYGMEGNSLSGAGAFAQWFRDVPGVNLSRNLAITLRRSPGSNVYTFDDTIDETYKALGGFFPINGELFGNYKQTGRNFHFTFEMETKFTYEEGSGQVFTFSGDDAIWVYVDDKLVIDLGGVHGKLSQTIDMDRVQGLESGKAYTLKLFFAERHTEQSNFRIDTTIPLKSVSVQPAAGLYD